MSKKSNRKSKTQSNRIKSISRNKVTKPVANSLLDVMVNGVEFESLCNYNFVNINIANEIRRSIHEIEIARGKRAICYFANLFTAYNSIDGTDDLPFSEMINAIPNNIAEIDVMLVTPGGSGEQVASFVEKLRNRFTTVNFIVIDKAMSAGTIFIMSGDDIVMSKDSKFGPIDPQILSNDGRYIPAQSILLTIRDIQDRGVEKLKNHESPNWTDIQILQNIHPAALGNAIGSSEYSIELVTRYLHDYKFKNWTVRRTSGQPVTDAYRSQRAKEIAKDLCDHSKWKSHGYEISRDEARNVCKLDITNAEVTPGLDDAMRRLRALLFWMGTNMNYIKMFASQEYCLIKSKN
ncbi:MAG: hypothetical protein II822_09950 [Prevotella sp.]|nr:hypothetical protein [Prevotella sp.]